MTTTILHIEDDPEIARATKRWLARLLTDVVVIHARDAKEAIALLDARQWDLVICDYDLGPGQNGGDVYGIVQSSNPSIASRFVFFSSSYEARRLVAGAGRFIDKPSDYATFAEVVRGMLGPAAGLSDADKLARCAGCRDDFYNGHNPMNVKRCWSFESADPVVRWRIGTWTKPTTPGAFAEVATLSCHRGEGYHHYKELPDVAIDPVRLRVRELP